MSAKKYRFLVLFEEMAPYFWECLKALSEKHPVETLVIAKKINPIAPFDFENIPGVQMMFRENYKDYELYEISEKFAPDAVYVSGWIHRPYHRWIKKMSCRKTILGFDTQWKGTLRQRAGAFYFRLFRKRYYTFAFVPNGRQQKMAEKMGFSEKNILHGLYSCNTKAFFELFENHISRRDVWPRNFMFIGRYVWEKGVDILVDAFLDFDKKNPGHDWKLFLVGKGPLPIIKHPSVIDLGFKQPQELYEIIHQAGFFVLPSRFEPYGVVLHEMASAGIPLIASRFCGAADDFLNDGSNGFLIQDVTCKAISDVMEKVLHLSKDKIREFSMNSFVLSKKNTPEIWAEKVFSILKS